MLGEMLGEMNSSNLFLVMTIVKLSIMPKYKQLRISHTIKSWQHLFQLFVQSVVEFRQRLLILNPTKQYVLTVIWIFRKFLGVGTFVYPTCCGYNGLRIDLTYDKLI
jgi:hypothetical protein